MHNLVLLYCSSGWPVFSSIFALPTWLDYLMALALNLLYNILCKTSALKTESPANARILFCLFFCKYPQSPPLQQIQNQTHCSPRQFYLKAGLESSRSCPFLKPKLWTNGPSLPRYQKSVPSF